MGGDPVLNKFACVMKARLDGTVKRRIIMDSKRSLVTEASRKSYRAVLPRATDLVHDILDLMATADSPEDLDILVLDAKDAFWQVPLHPKERRFYCAVLRRPNGKTSYVTYVRTAQGSRGAPLSWCIAFGLVCRCAFSVLRHPDTEKSQRMQIYVDDPVVVDRRLTGRSKSPY